MNKFKEDLQIENFIREEQRQIRLDKTLSNRQKMEQLRLLDKTLEDYKLRVNMKKAQEVIERKNEEVWEK